MVDWKVVVVRQSWTYSPSGTLQMPLFPAAHEGTHRAYPSRVGRVVLLYYNEDQQVHGVVSSNVHRQPALKVEYTVNP